MKKTITVNLGGRAFQITEDAYAQLSDYLSSIADCLKGHEAGEEIAADIESRISELCEERLQHNTIRIIDCRLVNDMIKRIGNPENMFAVNDDVVKPLMSRVPVWAMLVMPTLKRRVWRAASTVMWMIR